MQVLSHELYEVYRASANGCLYNLIVVIPFYICQQTPLITSFAAFVAFTGNLGYYLCNFESQNFTIPISISPELIHSHLNFYLLVQ